MRISLIGMAGTGKTYWSQNLSTYGFRWICCDDLIAGRLGPAMKSTDGTPMDMGAWMGFPDSPGYEEREALYLETEIRVMEEALNMLEKAGRDDLQVVLDTTGSVIYTGKEILGRLKRLTTVVYLETPPEVVDGMLRAYEEKPGPVLWQGLFRRRAGESRKAALSRCYPALLEYRRKRYERYADVTIGYYERRKGGYGVRQFLDAVLRGGEVHSALPPTDPRA